MKANKYKLHINVHITIYQMRRFYPAGQRAWPWWGGGQLFKKLILIELQYFFVLYGTLAYFLFFFCDFMVFQGNMQNIDLYDFIGASCYCMVFYVTSWYFVVLYET